MKSHHVESGYYDYRSGGPLLVCVWKDKRIINLLSTIHVAKAAATVPRRAGDGTRKDVTCPPCLPEYTAYLQGVDMADYRITYYNVGRWSRKWWKRVFSYGIEVTTLNAFIIKQRGCTGRDERDYLDFRLALAEELVGSFSSGAGPVGCPRTLEHHHEIRLDRSCSHLPVVEGLKRDCVVCSKVRDVNG